MFVGLEGFSLMIMVLTLEGYMPQDLKVLLVGVFLLLVFHCQKLYKKHLQPRKYGKMLLLNKTREE